MGINNNNKNLQILTWLLDLLSHPLSTCFLLVTLNRPGNPGD
ncbi:hypothetical protein EC990713_4163 [Escherichia coli 99.0713]|nr:hypothetical protein EC990713_4163 [Escherichia coli 99.0713]